MNMFLGVRTQSWWRTYQGLDSQGLNIVGFGRHGFLLSAYLKHFFGLLKID